MRISFIGKGGSGKTTVAAAFTRYLAQLQKPVIAIDADHNMHLQKALQIVGEPRHLSANLTGIKTYVAGDRADLAGTTMIDSTPPSVRSRFIYPRAQDPFLQEFGLQDGAVTLLTVGSYTQEDAGKTCYHAKLGGLSLVLNHLLDGKDDMVVADSTAGIDTLGSALYFAYDLTVLVVEPTEKSISVYAAFETIAKQLGIRTGVIVNKIQDGDLDFVKKHIPPEKIIGAIPQSSAVKRADQGQREAFTDFVQDNEAVWQTLYAQLTAMEKNWDKYYQDLLQAHKALATEWYDAYYGQPISTQQDPQFSYRTFV